MTVSHFLRRFVAGAGFAVFYIVQLVQANLRVAYDIVRPNYTMNPAVLAFPLEAKTDLEITLLATLITLTPGSLALDVSSDRDFLYVHVMYLDEWEEFKKFERKLLAVLR